MPTTPPNPAGPSLSFDPTPAAPAPPKTAGAPPALTLEQLTAIKKARLRAKKARRAASVAFTDASIMAFFAVCSILFTVFDKKSIIVGLPLAAVAMNAFIGARQLTKFDLRGPRRLALNQGFLAAIIIAYCAWSLFTAASAPRSETTDFLRENGLSEYADLEATLTKVVYSAVIVGTIVAQGFMALYYYTRRTLLESYLADTPPWVVELLQSQHA